MFLDGTTGGHMLIASIIWLGSARIDCRFGTTCVYWCTVYHSPDVAQYLF